MENFGKKHCLHVYTGEGKGKTSAAMGLALRMLGHGKKVLVVQFMKQPDSGELKSLALLPGAHVQQAAPMMRFTFDMDDQELEETKGKQTEELLRTSALLREVKPDLTVLDELNVALSLHLVPMAPALELLKEALRFGEVAVTGRGAPKEVTDLADYVSRIEAVKHPFDDGLPAREGIEW